MTNPRKITPNIIYFTFFSWEYEYVIKCSLQLLSLAAKNSRERFFRFRFHWLRSKLFQLFRVSRKYTTYDPNTFYSLAEFPLAFWYLFYFLLQKIFFWFSECPDSDFPILNLFDQIATETFSLICYIFHFNCFIYIIWFFSIALKLKIMTKSRI